MYPIPGTRILAISALAYLVAVGELGAQTHCTPDEDVVFSCPIRHSKNVVSLCASRNLLALQGKGYLFYHFGAIGSVALSYPPNKNGSPEQFSYSHYFRPQTDRTQLAFRIDNYTYMVFDTLEDQSQSAGIVVTNLQSSAVITLFCTKGAVAHWYRIDGAVPCSEDDDPSTCHFKPTK